MDSKHNARLFIGGLSEYAVESEIRSIFSKCGRVKSVWIARRPPGFGFVVFEDPRDAKYAVRKLDGTEICGGYVSVEFAHNDPAVDLQGDSGPPVLLDVDRGLRTPQSPAPHGPPEVDQDPPSAPVGPGSGAPDAVPGP
ncbi:hypothetical protein FO519_000266 [Halicephalobus sp. NKZ332]|nr:hypothetical protein FO519_000266 [Halicephalobus sp. NKZ332]